MRRKEASAAPSAQTVAAHASAQHGRAVALLSRSDADFLAAGPLQCFTETFASALAGPAPQSEGKTRGLRTEAEKLAAYCLVVRAAAAAADQPAFAEVSRAASKALRAKFGGGSITSAFAWLTGGAGRDALQSVLAGEVELTGPLSLGQIVAAAALGQETDMLAALLREKS